MTQAEAENFKVQAEKLEKEALEVINNINGWTYLKTVSNIKVYWKSSTYFTGHIYKFVVEVDALYSDVFDVMIPPSCSKEKLKWDKSLKHYEQLRKISEDISVGLIITPTAAMGLISKREFIDLYCCKTYDYQWSNPDYGKTCWIFGNSVDIPDRAITPGCVRGLNYPGGYGVAENKRSPDKCFVELYVHTDVGGMIPRSLVEAALPLQQVSYVTHLVKEVKRRKK
ncbi:stAR-related lipid transfer protein 6-like [Ciona intestinalis]